MRQTDYALETIDGFHAQVETWINPEGVRRFAARLMSRTTIYYTGYGYTEAATLRDLLSEAAGHSEYTAGLVRRLTGIGAEKEAGA